MRRISSLLLLAPLALAPAGCDFVGDVLEFGFWTILILVGLVLLLAWGLIRALRGPRRPPPPPPAP